MDLHRLDINLTEIETIALNSQVISTFCISWSQDNKILILAEGGVYVFELLPIPLTYQSSVTFLKNWIPVSSKTPLTDAVINDKNGVFFWGLEGKEAFDTAVDSTLSHVIPKSITTFSVPHNIQCKFSPLINNKSYLCCLTNYGLLEIFDCINFKYIPILNITDLWISHVNAYSQQRHHDFISFKSQMYKIKIINIQWHGNVLLTCHEDGTIVVWNSSVCNSNITMNIGPTFSVKEKPCCVEALTGSNSSTFLFIGTFSGILISLLVNLNTGELKQKTVLWENKDLLAPTLINTKVVDGKILVLTIKRHIVLIQTVNGDTGEVESTKWQEFPAEIVSINEYQNKFIICLQNHGVFELSIAETCHNLAELDMKPKYKTTHHCYGLTMSGNKAIWLLVSSPKLSYDSLKSITQLVLYSPETKTFKSVSDTSVSKLIDTIVKDFPDTRLSDIYDLLELKKFEMLTEGWKFRETYNPKKNCSLIELQVMLWEVKMRLFGNSYDNELAVTELETLISKTPARKIVDDFENLEELSELQRQSLIVCRMYLSEDVERYKASFGLCSICGGDVFFEDIRVSFCSNSHRFPRCCLSLLPCDVCPYAICKICDSVALLHFVSESNNRCPYCDGLLEHDSRIKM